MMMRQSVDAADPLPKFRPTLLVTNRDKLTALLRGEAEPHNDGTGAVHEKNPACGRQTTSISNVQVLTNQ
jgi:hypothetical protein